MPLLVEEAFEESHLEDDDNFGGSIDDMEPMVLLLHMECWHLDDDIPLESPMA